MTGSRRRVRAVLSSCCSFQKSFIILVDKSLICDKIRANSEVSSRCWPRHRARMLVGGSEPNENVCACPHAM